MAYWNHKTLWQLLSYRYDVPVGCNKSSAPTNSWRTTY